MFKKYSLILILSVIVVLESGAFDLYDPISCLGSEIEDIFSTSPVPDEIYPNRGVEPDEDNVIFYYSNGFYLFLFGNRLWQVRYDRTYGDLVYDLKMGMDRSILLTLKLNEGMTPLSSGDNYLTFQIQESPYPVRIKLFFVEDKLDDLYIYRADF